MNTVKLMDFKTAVRLIHPDVNPDIDDGSEKLHTLLTYRENKRMIYRFISEWGLIKPDANGNLPEFEEVEDIEAYQVAWSNMDSTAPKPQKVETVNNTAVNNTEIRVGDTVYIKTKNDAKAIVTNITDKRYYFTLENGTRSFCNKSNAYK